MRRRTNTSRVSPPLTRVKDLAAEFGKNDISKIYAGIVAPFGYRADDAADGIAAFTCMAG